MSESQTPRTDAAERDQEDRAEYRGYLVPARFARELESELNATRARLRELEGITERLCAMLGGDSFFAGRNAAIEAYEAYTEGKK